MQSSPEGFLRIGKSQGCTQYYHCKKGTSANGEYISKKNIDLARRLAQKSYDEKVCRYSDKVSYQITKLLKIYDDNKIEALYLSEHPARQELVTPAEQPYCRVLENWLSTPHIGKGFSEDSPVIITNNGTRVRSKSEKIIADYFEAVGLPYKYECPIHLKPFGTVYPDFTFLSPTGQEIYWEHEGMMDNPDYAKAAIQKIELYEKNGIYPGDRLILTFETSTSSINSEIIKNLVQKHLSKLCTKRNRRY